MPSQQKLHRREIVIDLTYLDLVAHILHDLEECADVILVRVGEKPSVDSRSFLSRQLFEIVDEISRVLAVTAVYRDDPAALGRYDEALHLYWSLGVEKVYGVIHNKPLVCLF